MQVDWITVRHQPRISLEHAKGLYHRRYSDRLRRYDLGVGPRVSPEEHERGGPYHSGFLQRVSPDGFVTDGGVSAGFVPRHDTNMRFLCRDGFSIEQSGNPVKWIQGHNVFGSADLLDLAYEVLGQSAKAGDVPLPTPDEYQELSYETVFTRIDLTRSYRFDSAEEATRFLNQVVKPAASRIRKVIYPEGVKFGQLSKYWQLVVYTKSDEVDKRKPSRELTPTQIKMLKEHTAGILRFEIRLLSGAIRKEEEVSGSTIDKMDLDSLWKKYLKRVTFNRNRYTVSEMNIRKLMDEIPPKLRPYVSHWAAGYDLREVLAKTAFYKHRKTIRDASGFDIGVPAPEEIKDNEELVADNNAEQTGSLFDYLDEMDKRWDPEPITELYVKPNGLSTREYIGKSEE